MDLNQGVLKIFKILGPSYEHFQREAQSRGSGQQILFCTPDLLIDNFEQNLSLVFQRVFLIVFIWIYLM